MKGNEHISSNTLQTVSRAVAVLRCFEGGAQVMSLAELTKRMGLNKVTVFRLATTLVQEGLLKQSPRSGTLSISYGLIALGRSLLDPEGLTSVARPALLKAREATGESINLNVREGWEAVVVQAVDSKQSIRYVLDVGYRSDLKIGAAGLAILAFMDEKFIENALKNSPPSTLSDGSAVDIEALRIQLQEIKRQGYARTIGQRAQGAVGIAVPFFDQSGEVLGSVSVIGPVFRGEVLNHSLICEETARKAAYFITEALAGRISRVD